MHYSFERVNLFWEKLTSIFQHLSLVVFHRSRRWFLRDLLGARTRHCGVRSAKKRTFHRWRMYPSQTKSSATRWKRPTPFCRLWWTLRLGGWREQDPPRPYIKVRVVVNPKALISMRDEIEMTTLPTLDLKLEDQDAHFKIAWYDIPTNGFMVIVITFITIFQTYRSRPRQRPTALWALAAAPSGGCSVPRKNMERRSPWDRLSL